MKNELSHWDYGGSYEVVIRVKEEDMKYFIKEIEKNFYLVEVGEENKALYRNIVANIMGRELAENDIIYERLSSIKRRLIDIFEGKPKTITKYVIYSNDVDGVYEIKMKYNE